MLSCCQLPTRLIAVPFEQVAPHWAVVLNLLAGSVVGAWLGATWATRLRSATLYRVLAVSLPTMLVAFARDSRDAGFVILRRQARFTLVMALGSVRGVPPALRNSR